jgi:hypothetical protein
MLSISVCVTEGPSKPNTAVSTITAEKSTESRLIVITLAEHYGITGRNNPRHESRTDFRGHLRDAGVTVRYA